MEVYEEIIRQKYDPYARIFNKYVSFSTAQDVEDVISLKLDSDLQELKVRVYNFIQSWE